MKLRNADLMVQEVDGETVLLDLASSTYFASNSTGTFLLQLLRQERERADLIEALAAQFGLDEAKAGEDVDAFVEALRAQDLLV